MDFHNSCCEHQEMGGDYATGRLLLVEWQQWENSTLVLESIGKLVDMLQSSQALLSAS